MPPTKGHDRHALEGIMSVAGLHTVVHIGESAVTNVAKRWNGSRAGRKTNRYVPPWDNVCGTSSELDEAPRGSTLKYWSTAPE